jgi:hypothetical protein
MRAAALLVASAATPPSLLPSFPPALLPSLQMPAAALLLTGFSLSHTPLDLLTDS